MGITFLRLWRREVRFDSAGRLVLEPKDHVRERLGFLPDLADALALTFCRDFSALYEPRGR